MSILYDVKEKKLLNQINSNNEKTIFLAVFYKGGSLSNDNVIACSPTNSILYHDITHIYFNDKQVDVIGEIEPQYSPNDDMVFSIFDFTHGDGSDMSKYDFLRNYTEDWKIYPHIDADRIGCLHCGSFFNKGDILCDCIANMDYIFADKITVDSFWIYSNGEIIDNKKNLVDSFKYGVGDMFKTVESF